MASGRVAIPLRFTKMHGTGNDFIVVDGLHYPDADPAALARRLCDRHFGIGGDGVILALPSQCADARMVILNADGSEAEMCGNGIRCLGKYLYDSGLCPKPSIQVETLTGVLTLTLEIVDGLARRVSVDMGVPCFEPERIPVDAPSNALTLEAAGRALRFFCVGMGNPHAVTFDLYPDGEEFSRLGALLECHPAFPHRANIEFCRVKDGSAEVRVWERGVGPTLACGTGACAALAAGAAQGLLPRAAALHLPGGELEVRWGPDGHLYLTGAAETVYTGQIEV